MINLFKITKEENNYNGNGNGHNGTNRERTDLQNVVQKKYEK